MTATALVTGVSGQDGVLLARQLLASGTKVVGTIPPGTRTDPHLVYLDEVTVVEHDLRDTASLTTLLREHRPDHVYNLASFSSVGASWEQPELVAEVNGRAVARLVEALLAYQSESRREVRLLQASSAEELGTAADSPYARAKRFAREAVVAAREQHGLYACAAILYNHESPLRGRGFVTRKITRAAAEISLGRRDSLTLGNLGISRDWGAAREYVDALARMLAAETPRDLPLGTGRSHTLQQLVSRAFAAAGLGDPREYVQQDPALLRPADAATLVADPRPAAAALGWRATVTFDEVIDEMVAVDLRRLTTGVEESPHYLLR